MRLNKSDATHRMRQPGKKPEELRAHNDLRRMTPDFYFRHQSGPAFTVSGKAKRMSVFQLRRLDAQPRLTVLTAINDRQAARSGLVMTQRPRRAHELAEMGPAHMHERVVVTAFEIDIGLLGQAFLPHRGNTIGLAHWRHRPRRAIRKQSLQFALARE